MFSRLSRRKNAHKKNTVSDTFYRRNLDTLRPKFADTTRHMNLEEMSDLFKGGNISGNFGRPRMDGDIEEAPEDSDVQLAEADHFPEHAKVETSGKKLGTRKRPPTRLHIVATKKNRGMGRGLRTMFIEYIWSYYVLKSRMDSWASWSSSNSSHHGN